MGEGGHALRVAARLASGRGGSTCRCGEARCAWGGGIAGRWEWPLVDAIVRVDIELDTMGVEDWGWWRWWLAFAAAAAAAE